MLKLQTPVSKNMILFEDKGFKEVIRLKRGPSVGVLIVNRTGILLRGRDTDWLLHAQGEDHGRTWWEGTLY